MLTHFEAKTNNIHVFIVFGWPTKNALLTDNKNAKLEFYNPKAAIICHQKKAVDPSDEQAAADKKISKYF